MGSASARVAFGSRFGRRRTCVAIGGCCGRCAPRCARSPMSGLRCCSARRPLGATTSARMSTCSWSCTIRVWAGWLSWRSVFPGGSVARCSWCGSPRRRPRLCSWSTSSITGVYWSIEMIFGPTWERLLRGGGVLPVASNAPRPVRHRPSGLRSSRQTSPTVTRLAASVPASCNTLTTPHRDGGRSSPSRSDLLAGAEPA